LGETAVAEFFGALEPKLNARAEKLAGLSCVYQFDVGEESYSVSFSGGKAAVAPGAAQSPNCTVRIGAPDFLDLVSGKLNGQTAFLTGKLKVVGDMGLALKLGEFFKG
jgi:putative sterol carrier protein